MRHHLRDTLTHEDVWPNACRERVVATRILHRLLHPEVVTEDGVEIQSTVQRLKRPAPVDIHRPRNEVLLQGHSDLSVVGVVFGHKSHQQLGFPLLVPTIFPAYSDGEQAHVATKLQHVLRGNEAGPPLAIIVHALVVPRHAALHGDALARIGHGVARHIHQRVVASVPRVLRRGGAHRHQACRQRCQKPIPQRSHSCIH